MSAVVDSFSAPNNATFERFYQVTNGGVAQDITGWVLHSQWRNADGSLALDLTIENGLIVVISATTGQFKKLVPPSDLIGITGSVTFDILAIPPAASGVTPRVYCPFTGTATLTLGSTLAGVT